MAGVQIKLDKHTLKTLNQKLDQLQSLVGNLRGVMDEIGAQLVSTTTQRFHDSKTPDGIHWSPVERWDKASKSYRPATPLVHKTHLRDSIHSQASESKVEIGSNLIYAAIHQLGGKTGRNKSTTIVARPFLGVSAEDEREIGNTLQQHIQSGLS